MNHRRNDRNTKASKISGLTLLELVAVIVIISILSSIGANVFFGQIKNAKIAATRVLISELQTAITRYQIDVGTWPPSGSGNVTTGTLPSIAAQDFVDGAGLLHLALVHSLSGDSTNPSDQNWAGPYMGFQADRLTTGTPGQIQMLDSFGTELQYVRSDDYTTTYTVSAIIMEAGTIMFDGTESASVRATADPDLPSPNPFFGGERFYNVSTFQLFSFGPDGTTFGFPDSNSTTTGSRIYRGTERDDINNFGY